MEHCIACGKPTGAVYTLYEARMGEVETREARTEYLSEGTSRIRRVHYKVITPLDAIEEHHFGFCEKCLTRNRRRGFKLLFLGAPAFIVPAAGLFLYSRSLSGDSGTGKVLAVTAAVTGFIGLMTAFISLHFIFAGKRTLPYDRKKPEFDEVYRLQRKCLILTPNEYDFYRKNDMKDVKNRVVDFPA